VQRIEIAGLVLAAGASSRMGPGCNKLTAIVAGKALVAGPVDVMREAGVDRVFVVVGHEADEVRAALGDRDCTFVDHPGAAAGMGTSIASGVSGLLSIVEPRGIMICVGDLAGLQSEWVVQLLGVFESAASPEALCVPTCDGRFGHPVIFGSAYFDALGRLEGDRGARSLLERHAEHVLKVEIGSDAILRDIDTPDDLTNWKS
jgi:molybdenum cofactor cytidylyltransferase